MEGDGAQDAYTTNKTGEVTIEYERHGRDPYPWRAQTKQDGVWYAGDNLDHAMSKALRAWFEEMGGVKNE